jgi:hypothetical protein
MQTKVILFSFFLGGAVWFMSDISGDTISSANLCL